MTRPATVLAAVVLAFLAFLGAAHAQSAPTSAIADGWTAAVNGWTSLDAEADDAGLDAVTDLAGRHGAECDAVETFAWALPRDVEPSGIPYAFVQFDQALMLLSAVLTNRHGALRADGPFRGMSTLHLVSADERVFGYLRNGQAPSGLTRHLTLCRSDT